MPEMRVPLKWLKEYVDIVLPLEELAERMTLAGLEVNSIEQYGAAWDPTKIVVGRIIEVRPHPDADSLVIAVVDHGADEPQAVVTGAPNVRVGESGQKIVFARRGAQLVDAYADEHRYVTLKPAKIRGVRSEGMVCSEKELDISDEHTGILLLPDDAPVGVPLQEYLGDTVLNIEIIPNIARCLSVVGVAREVAVLTQQALRLPELQWTADGPPAAGRVEIEIADTDLCSRYSGGLIEGVQIGASPLWLKLRLLAAGMRPINNVVDITNYIMLEWGQPLHAFDYATLQSRDGRRPPEDAPVIIVRRAKPGEAMTTLDGVDRALDPEMLLITDGGGPVALAGVMGGLVTEVTDATKDILLEAANFDYINNRRTSELLNLPSEAATRFGRAIDPELTVRGLMQAAELMRTMAGGTIAEGIVDAYPVPTETRVIDFPPSEVARLVGVKLGVDEISGILTSLEFGCELPAREGDPIRVTVPSHRLDVSMSADLVEEVARIYGSAKIPLTLMEDELPPQRNNPALTFRASTRDVLVSCGLAEIITYSLVGAGDQARLLAAYGADKPFQSVLAAGEAYPTPCILPPEDCVALANPMTPEQRLMRTTLMSRMLTTLRDNLRYQQRVALFEVARVYLPRAGQELPDEPEHLCIAMTGPRMTPWWAGGSGEAMDFYDLKGVLETLLRKMGIESASVAPAESRIFQTGRAASILVSGVPVGLMGEVHPAVRKAFDLPAQRVCLLELDLDALAGGLGGYKQYNVISRFPLVSQDLALVVDKATPARRVQDLIWESGGVAIAQVKLFDVYEGEPVPEGKKSLAYSISYQDMERTLTDKAVTRIRQRICKHLEQEIGAQVRS